MRYCNTSTPTIFALSDWRGGHRLPSSENGSVTLTLKPPRGYTHLVAADDVRVAEQLGALLDKKFFAQDLPKLTPETETASELISEAV